MQKILACLPLWALLLAVPAFAVDAPAAATAKAPASTTLAPKETKSVTQGSVVINGQTVKYTATAGTLILRDEKNEPTGSMFYVAYTKDGADVKTRPLTFVYNGGPGSSSIWLEMGAFGPVRVEVADAQATP
ncbi:MAG: peptidase S10, partial [Gammaproteobacteria bacterium]|nr:peptidase S10 [Gammaproteobacteria bacterium]